MNLAGIIKGGLVAGLLINVSEFILNMFVIPMPEGAGGSMGLWVVYAFVLGILVAYMYAVARPRWGAGAKAAVCAGVMVWVLHNLLPGIAMMNMGMAPDGMFLALVWTLVEMGIAGYLAGMLYSEA